MDYIVQVWSIGRKKRSKEVISDQLFLFLLRALDQPNHIIKRNSGILKKMNDVLMYLWTNIVFSHLGTPTMSTIEGN